MAFQIENQFINKLLILKLTAVENLEKKQFIKTAPRRSDIKRKKIKSNFWDKAR